MNLPVNAFIMQNNSKVQEKKLSFLFYMGNEFTNNAFVNYWNKIALVLKKC